MYGLFGFFVFFKQKTAYEMRISDWSSDVCSSDLLSADQYAIERLNLKLGDTMTLDFAGEQQTFTVTSFRTVDWDSFKPNFFLLAPPGAVSDLVPRQYLTSFYLPHDQRTLLKSEEHTYELHTLMPIS